MTDKHNNAHAVLQGWAFSVSDDDDGTWLRVKSPGGREAAFSAVNGGLAHDNRRSIASRVLLELKEALATAPPPAPAVPQEQPDTFYERNAKFREENWQIRFDAAVEARRQAQEQLYSERERHASEIQALRQEISRLLPSQPVMLAATPATPSQEPVMWQYRSWFAENTGTPGWSEWAEVKARNAYTGTVMDSVREFQHYIAQGYKYEIRALYVATPAPAPAQESGLTDEAVNDAAKVLAERFDYPWEHMPEAGRKNMRTQARAVVIAALRAKGGKL